jgi:hypothetical protein
LLRLQLRADFLDLLLQPLDLAADFFPAGQLPRFDLQPRGDLDRRLVTVVE